MLPCVTGKALVDSRSSESDGLDNAHPWFLRQEARELWDSGVSDEVVYLCQPSRRNLKLCSRFAQLYLQGEAWFRLQFFLKGHWDIEFDVIIEVSRKNPRTDRERYRNRLRVDRKDHMLREIRKFVELPEGMKVKGIPSTVRLKRSNRILDGTSERLKPFLESNVSYLDNRERDVLVGLGGLKQRQLPSEIVQPGAQAVDELFKAHGYDDGDWLVMKPSDVASVFQIVFVGDGVWFPPQEGVKVPVERIEVLLSPFHFHYRMEESRHQGTIG